MKRSVIRIIAALALLITAAIVKTDIWWLDTLIFLVPYLIVGYDVLIEAVSGIFRGAFLDENFLMAIATVGAFAIGEYTEAVGVMLFYKVGETFEQYAVGKSRKSIAELMNIRPDYANVLIEGEIVVKDPEEVGIGSKIIVKPGEKVPLDGIVIKGTSYMDTSALTGESVPRSVAEGDEVLSGCINTEGLLEIEVTKEFGDSTVSKILDMVENASNKKSNSENFISRFAAVYTPVVVISAVILALLPPLLIPGQSFSLWLYRALSFLVVSCPCALVISIPLSFFGGIGGASRAGVLVKGSNYLEALAKTETVVFDKTGTLTKGVFAVRDVCPAGDFSREELLTLAALAENYSDHPISKSLRLAAGEPDAASVTDAKEIAGHGVEAIVGGKKVLAGNHRLMEREKVEYIPAKAWGTVVYVAVDGSYAGHIIISDEIKADAAAAVKALRQSGVAETVLLTGDIKENAEAVQRELGIDRLHAGLLPGDKVAKLEEILKNKSPKATVAFVGDGINDAPVLARADVGIAMGAMGSDAAIEAADIVIMTDEPSKISTAIKIARRTLSICRQNIVFAIGIKVLVLVLTAFGFTNMWAAVFADVGVAVLAILNSMRTLKKE